MNKKPVIYLLSFLALALLGCALIISVLIFGPINKTGEKTISIYIPTGANYQQTIDTIRSRITIRNPFLFKILAEKKNYPANIKPGKYTIKGRFSYVELINILRSGCQTPVDVTFNNIRTLSDLAGRVGRQIEADSLSIIKFLNDDNNYLGKGFKKETIISLFIPDTYEFYWNTNAEGFFLRMLKEYQKFWNNERLVKAKEKNLSLTEVSILASIIDNEVAKSDEKPRIAGVYLNRLKKGMPLQADPTILFALNDFSITRVLYKHLNVDSPYNTYRHSGFPPGPIGCSTIEGIDAVLNAEKHEYYYFSAKPDFSGYHNFSKSLTEHNRYAALYQKELDKRKIFK